MHIHAALCCVLRAGQPLPTISSSSGTGNRQSAVGAARWQVDKKLVLLLLLLRACSVVPAQVGHSFALVNTFTQLVHLLLGYVPVPCSVPVPLPVQTPCFQAKLTFCLRSQLCSFNNLLGRLSPRTGQAEGREEWMEMEMAMEIEMKMATRGKCEMRKTNASTFAKLSASRSDAGLTSASATSGR